MKRIHIKNNTKKIKIVDRGGEGEKMEREREKGEGPVC